MPSCALKTLPAKSVDQLAHILQTPPSEHRTEYSERVSSTLKDLPSDLKRKSRLSNFFTSVPSPKIRARLCVIHRPLAASLIHEIFTLLSLEVGHHCNSLIQHNNWLRPEQNVAIQQLRELHSLWLPAETYAQTFLASANPRWPHQKSGCEGCILTRIGSDWQIVAALRTLLMSRRRTVKPQKGHPRLLPFVNGWVVGLVGRGHAGREMMQGTEMEAEELKIVRKRIWKQRKEKRKGAKGKSAGDLENLEGAEKEDWKENDEKKELKEEEAIGKEAYDSDFEDKIIDHYAALRSTLYKPSANALPARTPSLTTGTSAQTLSSRGEIEDWPPQHVLPHRPASSIYTTNQSCEQLAYEPPRRAAAWCGQDSAGKQAQQYRDLLPLPEEAFPRSKSLKEGTRQEDRNTGTLPTLPSVQPLPRSTSLRDDHARRQTKWSLFSWCREDRNDLQTDATADRKSSASHPTLESGQGENEAGPRAANERRRDEFAARIRGMLKLMFDPSERLSRNQLRDVRKSRWPFLSWKA